MEKFSNYRDAGTGIQPFLTPLPPAGSEILVQATLPIRYALAAVRTALLLVLLLAYVLIVRVALLIFLPISPVYDLLVHLNTAILGRSALFILGLVWIPVDYITKKRKSALKTEVPWNPKAGDIIVSNWVSWIELIWLAIRFNPIFVLPIPASEASTAQKLPTPSSNASPIAYTPGRRTGTGSANIQQAARSASARIPVAGFRQVSLLQMITSTGRVPYIAGSSDQLKTIEDIRKKARRPIVVFPECTTSNGRGLLRFANVFNMSVPVKGFDVFVMCVRFQLRSTDGIRALFGALDSIEILEPASSSNLTHCRSVTAIDIDPLVSPFRFSKLPAVHGE
ncbi:hypothetical protein D9611_014523 [Ephemerocybe angulata]|uniref:Phospholipid/glycerol acyltransferase domain-containing protein n=1 Tax=Ephemerocybe angulata TaxID=980116 RepID=A0A8H5B6W7_9AGAR|nr:hypothetical protein D9611_014422 [Tulosesus angulatus]KAF5337724.1 hypothetical protein D9611_014523 [Tulosesus angulatus]